MYQNHVPNQNDALQYYLLFIIFFIILFKFIIVDYII